METIAAPLKGKVAIVTGGSRGIGAGVVHKFAEYGCTHIAITYVSNKQKAEDVLASARKISPSLKAFAVAGDVRDPAFGSNVVRESLVGLGVDHIDIVISNASWVDMNDSPPVASMQKEQWDAWITSQAWAPLSLAKEVIEYMPPGGRIVMLSSTVSKLPEGDPVIGYAAGKAALDAVSKNLAATWGVKYGVTVNTISVGPTETDSFQNTVALFGPDFKKTWADSSLLKRTAEVEEVVNIVTFVASPQASWITGNQIPANGGALSVLQS